ncbi:MAG: ABC transporter ATP-binding protein [Candidatus Marinimicrobia bacterium]|jgi:ABC-2 type transport system ATP-binding protein|nr:ABC transporter ATP-binding protein [Candidatus Neomarinimicrobiota bacterium]MBT3634578.1 ABC transporter ATP-binding protein [Candidatus Neomarinimicrobiota bacterium]MBT3683341.1 ABC transporter ATP-binding protein [Candidatus Neomarinimicrobiota bacterium]MBT3760232.1 ABC transporter ATP-binding protein [Candidatus Neomarinimicrobiota bacterium]MBT3896327.1 ABC transporter ATP-binding protein [Candidatus Neomarinimicrobiota bacterium]
MDNLVSLNNLSKSYGKIQALSNITFQIPTGRIIGLIGPNGSGKTTLLRAMTGLIDYEGSISMLGVEPKVSRSELMENTGVIHDISVLPPWMKVSQVVEFKAGVQSAFNYDKCVKFLDKTSIKMDSKVKHLSKGMKTQLHLALVLATDTKLLILDEPTHGLDILFRKELYSNVLEEYFDNNKSVIISTHQVEEVEHILSDVIFLKDGYAILYDSVENLKSKYYQLIASDKHIDTIRKMNPITEHSFFGKRVFLLENADREKLESMGEVSSPSIADIFVAIMGGKS